jgi:hypothetical protein
MKSSRCRAWRPRREDWRTGRDSNPRTAINRYTLSRRAPSTARPPVRSFGVSPERAGTIAASIRRARNLEAGPEKPPPDGPLRSRDGRCPQWLVSKAASACAGDRRMHHIRRRERCCSTFRRLLPLRPQTVREDSSLSPKGSPSRFDQSGADFGHALTHVDRSLFGRVIEKYRIRMTSPCAAAHAVCDDLPRPNVDWSGCDRAGTGHCRTRTKFSLFFPDLCHASPAEFRLSPVV